MVSQVSPKPLSEIVINLVDGSTRMHVSDEAHKLAELDRLRGEDRVKAAKKFAEHKASLTASRAAKETVRFETKAKNRFEDAVCKLDFSGWSMANPPRMATLKTPGRGTPKGLVDENFSGTYWFDLVSSSKVMRKGLRTLASRHKSAFKFDLDAIDGLQFQRWGNPHFHLLLTVPMNLDGTEMLSNHPTGRGGRFAHLNGLRFWEWLERTWAEILGVQYDISNPQEHGKVTWLPRAEEVPAANSIEELVMRFVYYMRLDNEFKYRHKLHQQEVPWQWAGQQVSFWGITGFVNKRRKEGESLLLHCFTDAAERAALNFLHEASGSSTREVEFDGEIVDISYWSPERSRRQGGKLNRPLTMAEVRRLRRLVAMGNAIPDVVTETVETVEEFEDARPNINSNGWKMRSLIRKAAETTAPWERDGFDVDAFVTAYEEPDTSDYRVEVDEDAQLPITDLLAALGFTEAEQHTAELSAAQVEFQFSTTD